MCSSPSLPCVCLARPADRLHEGVACLQVAGAWEYPVPQFHPAPSPGAAIARMDGGLPLIGTEGWYPPPAFPSTPHRGCRLPQEWGVSVTVECWRMTPPRLGSRPIPSLPPDPPRLLRSDRWMQLNVTTLEKLINKEWFWDAYNSLLENTHYFAENYTFPKLMHLFDNEKAPVHFSTPKQMENFIYIVLPGISSTNNQEKEHLLNQHNTTIYTKYVYNNNK